MPLGLMHPALAVRRLRLAPPRRARTTLTLAILALAAASCVDKGPAPQAAPSSEPSPNASIFPAPLESAHDTTWSGDAGDADADSSVLATWMREDQPLPPDPLTSKEAQGFTLEARFVWPAAASSLESQPPNLRLRSFFALEIDLSPAGRMRIGLGGAPFVLPRGTELRARADSYGHVLVWPDGQSYRVLQPGTLRAVLAERRCDIGPLVQGEHSTLGAATVLGLPANRTQVSSPLGVLTLAAATVPGSAQAGILLCRTLLELVGVDPANPACAEEQVPLRGEFAWTSGGRLLFEVTSLLRPRELPLAALRAPPANPHFKGDLLPPEVPRTLLAPHELSTLRARDEATGDAGASGPDGVTSARNETSMPLYLLLDGVPSAWVRPGSEVRLPGLRRGRYSVTWRDFFGHDPEPARAADLPAPLEIGIADGGTVAP